MKSVVVVDVVFEFEMVFVMEESGMVMLMDNVDMGRIIDIELCIDFVEIVFFYL